MLRKRRRPSAPLQSSPERLMEVMQLLLAFAGAELCKMALLKLLF